MQNSQSTHQTKNSILKRVLIAITLISNLRWYDITAAKTLMTKVYGDSNILMRIIKLIQWTIPHLLNSIPNAITSVEFSDNLTQLPYWLSAKNPLENYPWTTDPQTQIPEKVDVVVIGAGFTGAASAYHWSKQAGGSMAVLEMNEASSGASGRNAGIVVMGRYFATVKNTVYTHLQKSRKDLNYNQQDKLSNMFASIYVQSAYKNADMIEKTILDENIDCEYSRKGWIQWKHFDSKKSLDHSVQLGNDFGFNDWTKIEPEYAEKIGGIKLGSPAGFSRRAATWHPAKWVWGLLKIALKSENVKFYTHTKVGKVEDLGTHYLVHTNRGKIKTQFVINATESYTTLLHPYLKGLIHAAQSQAAYAEGGPKSMKPAIGLMKSEAFFVRRGNGVLFGSDETPVSYQNAGRNRPSRFITKYVIGESGNSFGPSSMKVTNEWSGTVGYTDDEFPVIGLLDNKRQYIIAGQCGSGSGVHFNAARHIVQQILGLDGPNDYPDEYFSPKRIMDPQNHSWPSIE